jgi:short-subunit dehydrogenase
MKAWKHALITGAGQGIGKALCLRLLDEGVKVTSIDRDPISWAHKNKDKLLNHMQIDLINLNSVNDIVSNIKSIEKLDLVVHNAGISATGKFEDIDPKAYENVLKLNTTVPMQLSATLMQNRLFANSANLAFISSLSHATGYPGAAVYGASKDAIAIYAKSIRKPFAKKGVSVLSVFPGPVRTEHAERHAPQGADASKRMLPDELASKILSAASSNKKTLYPGAAAQTARILGKVAPNLMTNMMRKIIYDKLDRPVW